jgi:wyosine [tRNA(Phe)-imidazoG37] synthetase (radical SAM superfamily)
MELEKAIQIGPELAAVRDHGRQFRDFTYVYPVISRRSRGLSIGINLNPDKTCNFDCVYCEVDRTVPPKTSRVDLRQVRDELVAMVRFVKDGGLAREPKFRDVPSLSREIKDLAFSGNGEPTLVHGFRECVSVVAGVKAAERLHCTKIVLITDGAGLNKLSVKRGLEIMDAHQGEVWAKLDAGTEPYFRRVNRSHVQFERILKNLLETARLRPIVIQSLFLKMDGEPMPASELAAYCARIQALLQKGGQIKEIHAYTVARRAPEPFVGKLSKRELERMAETIRLRTGLTVRTFA